VIVLSVGTAVISTVAEIGFWLRLIELACVGLLTVEYGLRVWSSVEDRAGRYEHPFWGRVRWQRQASIITLSSCRLLELQASDFHRLLTGDPKLREMILQEVQRRNVLEASHAPVAATGTAPKTVG